MAKTVVVQADESECFYVANRQCISTLNELQGALEAMDDPTFHHHVNEQRNDFSNWAGGVLKDGDLSGKLLGAKDRKSAQIVVLKRIIALFKEIA